MVARFVGAGDVKSANHVAQQAFVIAAVVSIIMAAIGVFFAESILSVFEVEADVIVQGAPYLRIQLVGTVAMSLRFMGKALCKLLGMR